MKRQIFRAALLSSFLLFSVILGGCGGGGGGTGGGANPIDSIPYTGQTTQAMITAESAGPLSIGGYLGGVAGNDLGSAAPLRREAGPSEPETRRGATGLDTYLSVMNATKRILHAALPAGAGQARAMTPETWTDNGTCGGHAEYSIDANTSTGDFSGTITFVDYDDCESVLSGEFVVSGHYDPYSMMFTRLTISIFSFRTTSVGSGETVSICGTIATEAIVNGETTRLNMRERNAVTKLVFWYRDYVITTSSPGSYIETTVTGRYYDPDRGYADLLTVNPLRTYYENNMWNDYPSEGMLTASGRSGTTASLKFLSKNVYRVEADTDGDSTFDYDGGRTHWPGANILPVAVAGADQNGNVGCLTTLDGSGSSDGDGDTITYFWTIVSAPGGSTAVLSDNTVANPTFTPDVAGNYQFGLLIGDGIATAADTVSVAVGPDLFCANQAVLIPAAAGYFPRSVAIGDLDNDGRNDVVMATWTSYTPSTDFLFVFAQNATGGLRPPVAYPSGDGKSIAVGDLNSDGRNDIAATLSDGVGILYQNGSGGFNPMVSHGYGASVLLYAFHDVRIADLNNDGRKDLVTLYNNFDNAVVNVFYQNPDGTLAAPLKFWTDFGEWELRVGDQNNDGLTDILMFSNKQGTSGGSHYGNYVKVMLQNANGTLGNPTDYLSEATPLFIEPGTFAAGEVTGDARQDLVISSVDTNNVSSLAYSIGLFPQLADGTAGPPLHFPAFEGIRQVEAVDVSGDSRTDVVGYHSGNSTAITVYRQGQSGSLNPYEVYGIPFPNYNSFNHAFAIGDLNNDGLQDVAIANYITNESAGLVVLFGNSGRSAP